MSKPEPESTSRLEAILNNAVDAIITIDEQGIVDSANPAAERLFGYAINEIIGQNVKMLMPAPYREEHDGYLQNYVGGGPRKIIGIGREVVGRRKDGSTFPMHLAVSEFHDGHRRLFTGIVRDISDLKERQARLEAILNNAVDAIITIDEQGSVLSLNPATEAMFGYSSEEVLGRNVKMLMPSPYQEEHDGYLENYLETGIAKIIGSGREVIGKRKDGSTFPMHLAVSEIKVGGTTAFTGIVRDITDLKEAEIQLKQLNEELEERVRERTAELREAQAELVRQEKLATLGRVSGGIAHEIRNPLNAVKTSAYYLLNARNPTAEKTAEHLERIDRQVSMIDNVVTALSDVAKLPEPDRRPLAIDRFLRDSCKTVGLPADIEIHWDLQDDLPKVLADERQIPIVFKNLVRNARDAMENDGGQITVSATATGNQVHVTVSDTGIGIPKGNIKKILEPLFSTKARGMGLGLAITKAIVEKNGGKLNIESTEGKGSKFTVTLNIASDA